MLKKYDILHIPIKESYNRFIKKKNLISGLYCNKFLYLLKYEVPVSSEFNLDSYITATVCMYILLCPLIYN